jgi:hypothetical protein
MVPFETILKVFSVEFQLFGSGIIVMMYFPSLNKTSPLNGSNGLSFVGG